MNPLESKWRSVFSSDVSVSPVIDMETKELSNVKQGNPNKDDIISQNCNQSKG